MTLGQFTPANGWAMGKGDHLKIFKSNSAVDYKVVYMDQAACDKYNNKMGTDIQPGWYKDNDTKYTTNMNDVKLPYGTSVMAVSAKVGTYITMSGEVVQPEDGKIIFQWATAGDFIMIGNCTPVALTLGNFIPSNGWAMGKGDHLKIFKSNSAVDYKVVYMDQAACDKYNNKMGTDIQPGWYKDNDTKYTTNMNSTPIPAGMGMMAVAAKAGAQITIPSAL